MIGWCAKMWTAPYKPRGEISQAFNDGIVEIAVVQDTAEPGYKPKPTIIRRTALPFAEQRVGINRFYSAMQNQIRVDRLIRVPEGVKISTTDIAVVCGTEYRIDQIQTVDGVMPKSLDLTLTEWKQG